MHLKIKLATLLSILYVGTYAQDVYTGLKLANPQQLAGIPIASTPYSGDELPRQSDLSNKMPPVRKQQHQDCVAWAVAYAVKSYQEKIEEGNSFLINGQNNDGAVFCPSYIYNQINNGVDGGSYFQDALNILSQQGAAKMSVMPYDGNGYTTKPNQQQKDAAKNYKIDFWRQVNIRDIKEVKAQVNAGYPVMIGTTVDAGFRDHGWEGRSPYIWKNQEGAILGGHAMVVVGYDDNLEAFKIMNSWGQDWGNNGFCWISYSLFPVVVNEGYIAKDAQNGTANVPTVPTAPQNPTSDLRASFTLFNVIHNIPNITWGPGMNFVGNVQIPAGIGHRFQIVIKFYFNNGNNGKGMPVGSTAMQFSLPDGNAATGSQLSNAPNNGGVFNWNAGMPYNVLRVNRGGMNVFGQYVPFTSYLLAEPILYIDNFAVQVGQLVPFTVTL